MTLCLTAIKRMPKMTHCAVSKHVNHCNLFIAKMCLVTTVKIQLRHQGSFYRCKYSHSHACLFFEYRTYHDCVSFFLFTQRPPSESKV